ncbi:hypothetical protein BDF14DRAFT_1743965 [Spinellus fusiger]|nr:hypothetical protein BDF14DRAFT_1743965 [Spinellus fusiger]
MSSHNETESFRGVSEIPLSRFSLNSDLMNYSIPNNEPQKTRREIQSGDRSTQARQLENQIETLTLQNVKLQRTNRLLKVDTDNLIEQKTRPLEEKIRSLTLNNVQLQRVTRLLQQDLEEKTKNIASLQYDQIMRMKSVGPEYEFLVQMVNVLHRQMGGEPTCEETCCYTLAPIDQSSMVMTLPPEDDEEGMEAQHICRPIIHSSISQGSYAIELENKIVRLEQMIDELEEEKETAASQQGYKDSDIEMLKKELRIKDDIVSQLEQDFLILEDQLAGLQKELDESKEKCPSTQHQEPMHNPEKQSQMLMETKRRSLAIKDTSALEAMLRGDLESEKSMHLTHLPKTSSFESLHSLDASVASDLSTDLLEPSYSTKPFEQRMSSSNKPYEPMRVQVQPIDAHTPPTTPVAFDVLPGDYMGMPRTFTSWNPHDPFVPFALMAILLGIAVQSGITDDWTMPITLVTMVSGFLWSGAAKGVQLKVNLH